MNRTRFPVSAVCCLMLIALLLLSLGAVSAQSMESMDDEMSDDMMMDDMMMDDDMMMEDMMMPAPRICTDMPSHVAIYSDSFGISCSDVGTAGIGVMSIVDAGVTSAIDIWSPSRCRRRSLLLHSRPNNFPRCVYVAAYGDVTRSIFT